jgi:hypothetical protein
VEIRLPPIWSVRPSGRRKRGEECDCAYPVGPGEIGGAELPSLGPEQSPIPEAVVDGVGLKGREPDDVGDELLGEEEVEARGDSRRDSGGKSSGRWR